MAHRSTKLTTGAIVIGFIGYAIGVLTAPKSGKQLRGELRDQATRGIHEAERQLKGLHTELHLLLQELQQQTQHVRGSARSELQRLVRRVSHTKENARKALSAVHEGEMDSSEVQRAIDEANTVIETVKRSNKYDIQQET